MEDLARQFRAEVKRQKVGSGNGKRYPLALRSLAVRYYRKAVAAGEGRAAIAAELGVAPVTLLRWAESQSGASQEVPGNESAGALREVVIAGEVPRSSAVLVTPEGFRIEGLTPSELTAMLRALR